MNNLPHLADHMAIKQQQLGPGHFVLFDDALTAVPGAETFDPGVWQASGDIVGEATGRGTTFFIRRPDTTWVLRHFKRGGLVGKLLNDQYIYTGLARSRPFAEFKLLHAMREAGLNAPQPVSAQVVRSGLIYRADLITLMIPHSRDLHDVLCERELTDLEWSQVGYAVARMHNAQVYHHDLNVRNLMLDDSGNIWVIDLDRCYLRKGDFWKVQTLNRLARSLNKELARNSTFHFTENNWRTLINAYHEAVDRQ